MDTNLIERHLSFDDVLLVPQESNILPNEVSLKTKLTKNITLNIPIMSAAMDTVTDSNMAIAVALSGGIGTIHRNFAIEEQSQQVMMVKQFQVNHNEHQDALLDNSERLRVAAAIGTSNDDIVRAEKLIEAGADVIVVDTAHGHSTKVLKIIKTIKEVLGNIAIIAGNIATESAAYYLIEAGVEAVKVGIGPGSICTTRIISGVGVPQFSAIQAVAKACTASNVTLIADGGIKGSGDIAKAIGAGADLVMIGSLLAGTDESPGNIIDIDGKKYKYYRGMGSLGAIKAGAHDRYSQSDKVKSGKFVPEGVEGYTSYKGSTADVIYYLLGGLRSAMGYTGKADIENMKGKCKFVQITTSGIKESHVHSLNSFKDAPNYTSS
ncbi:Inosine-5'-monophosphate dehydrogenase [Candidatus Cyrtobacter comes]|uniref:Inosine-5'-monophosphate dehydrogenase n=1 Tax=Candidatus Cyrtobacter comes TaxID=675776 RepID=A0ABU5L782_9RICK|nr:IMP dehydrogenase [Candidatus Cyrtobacter comes]MDZ5761750.1 Inosine-5'-monophosphate dehydrogenase [Candidatus Cyrtobacter comes]